MLEVQNIEAYTSQGSYRPTMQDVVAYGKNGFNGVHILGIFDGHGKRGERVAEIASRAVNFAVDHEFPPDYNALAIAGDIGRVLVDMSAELVGYRRFRIDERTSGAAAAIAVIQENSFAGLWLGDCGICFVPDDEKIDAVMLTHPHHISDPDEKQNAIDDGAQVHRIEDNEGQLIGEYLVCPKTSKGGIKLTRAFGNADLPFLQHVPEFTAMQITRPGKIALFTDGFSGKKLSDVSISAIRHGEIDDGYVRMMADLTKDNAALLVATIGE